MWQQGGQAKANRPNGTTDYTDCHRFRVGERCRWIVNADLNGLYDLESDPHERHNLIRVPAFQDKAGELKHQLFEELGASGGLTMPIRPPGRRSLPRPETAAVSARAFVPP
jgi:hypothetical protein